MKIQGTSRLKTFACVLIFLSLCFPTFLQAQLVADGQTNVLDGGITNVFSATIGTNGSFTLLVVTNGSVVTNFGNTLIGASAPASNNRLSIGGAGSIWLSGYICVGSFGSSNELDVLAGGSVLNDWAYIGRSAPSSNNTLQVSDPGSLLLSQSLYVGYSLGEHNQLVVTNGGTVSCQYGYVDYGGGNNSAIVTGSNSLWTNNVVLVIGMHGPNNQLIISNGGTVFSGYSGLGMMASSSVSNRAVITDLGSVWTVINSNPFYAGYASSGNELDILNGGAFFSAAATIGANSNASNNLAFISGSGSLWTNSSLLVGNSGSGNTLIITNGGQLQTGDTIVGNASSSTNNSIVVSGINSVWNGTSLCLGTNGSSGNTAIVNNGATLTVGNLSIGIANSPSNSMVLSGGSITLTNGTLSLASYGNVTVNSGLLTAPSISSDLVGGPYGSVIAFNGGTIQAGVVDYQNPNPFVVGDGTDAATLELLYVSPSADGHRNFSGGVSIANNGMLKGFGQLTGDISVNSGGTIAPGTNSALGSITHSGNLTLNPGTTTIMKLDATSGASDSITGTTNLTYAGTLQLTTLSGSLSAGNSFKLFGATNYLGAFNNLVPATPGTGLRWDTNELNVDGVLRVFSVTTMPPSFSSITAASGILVTSANDGIPYDPCYLLTSSNLIDWSCVATNYFDFTGATSFTNSIPPDAPEGFFRLQVN